MMCGGGISKMTEDIYQKQKKDYGDLPSLAVGDKVKRTEDGMADIPKKKKKDVNKSVANTARSLLMPYAK